MVIKTPKTLFHAIARVGVEENPRNSSIFERVEAIAGKTGERNPEKRRRTGGK
jgi:hypothetical protein